jgi:predicted GTPase
MTGHTQILWSTHAREQAKRLIDAAPLNAVMTVKPPTRTIPQNKKMQAMLSDVSIAKPFGIFQIPDDWKCAFMNGLQYEMRSAFNLEGMPFPIGYRSSHMTKEQMSDMLELMYAFGARHGVQWAEPEA